MPLASLPWYDLAEVRPATDALWQSLARRLRSAGVMGVPAALTRHVPYEQLWTSPRFFFGQACGYDVLVPYAKNLQILATPCYAALGCQGYQYRSFVVVRDDSRWESLGELHGTRCVINTPTSHSGTNVLRSLVAPLHLDGRFFARVTRSGSHERSLAMILRGEADVAAIDCVTYALLARHRPGSLRGTRVLLQTEPAPAPPFVTSAATSEQDVQRLREALWQTMLDSSLSAAREALLLEGIEEVPLEAYQPLADIERTAQHAGYVEIDHALLAHQA